MTLSQHLKTRKKTHLIFDFDSTLAHPILPWDLWEENIKDQLTKIDNSIYKKYQNNQINLSQLENAYVKKDPKLVALMIKNSLKFEAKYLKEVVPNKELVNFVKNARNYQKFVWSSNTRPTIEKVLRKFKIFKKFKKIIARQDVDFLKPEPEGFFQIYDPKVPKSKYLYIGNNRYDEQAASAAGIDFYQEDYFK